MKGTVATYTVIHVAPEDLGPMPYAVVVVDADDGRRLAARADGDLSWLSIGAVVALEADDRFGLRALTT